jgi:RNA polymerase sigma-70 factor (ECF subfamily)
VVAYRDPPLEKAATLPTGVQSAAAGVAIEEIYAAQARTLTLQVYAYTGDMGAAQDIVQEAFCRALTRWSRISRYDDPVAWLRRVAWNLATSRWRRLRNGGQVADAYREESVPGPSADRVALTTALARLPAAHRRAVVLHYLGDLSTREIAEQEGVAESTVRVWLHRGRSALAWLLSERGTEDARA